eukprot:gnl/Dysnectes_brevis/6410_a9921_387.p1 GENE.gnl/Dysnectes_brevis/6410_a9921_387~~gnl/Dysnectes_brevis/6410_a9921_387.p1  ORF type:complete len:250 (+),score=54.48 gnl/Dysnectes_brevis/6410_a9921_387:98-847(+)
MSDIPLDLDESSSEDQCQSKTFKVVILGDGHVGKTSICNQFTKQFFAKAYKQTIGLDFFSHTLTLNSDEKEILVTFNLFDIGGQSLGSRMLSTYCRGADAVILCYDITSLDSFQNIHDWMEVVNDTFKGLTHGYPILMLMGNKVDIAHLRAVRSVKHREMATRYGMRQSLVSARTGDAIHTTFTTLAAELLGLDPMLGKVMGSTIGVVRAHLPGDVGDSGTHSGDEIGSTQPETDQPTKFTKQTRCTVF